LAAIAGLLSVGALCEAAAPPAVPPTATILVTAGFDTGNQACSTAGTSAPVLFTVSPWALTPSNGVDTPQVAQCTLPQYAEQLWDTQRGRPRYVCRCTARVGNLKSGSWEVTATGAAGVGWCLVDLTTTPRSATIRHGICGEAMPR
jgi:hypothetical protein